MRYCPACHSVYPNEFRTCPRDQQALLAASELQPGMVLRGKYEITGKLGAGGMAAVYRARHLAFGETRAIKVVNSRLADDEEFLKRFRNEAVVARRLQHPNAVRVDDLDVTEDGRPFIVMEYVEGPNLREVIRREGPLSVRRSVRIARQIASALAAAHDLGIIHRDIKPDNVLLAAPGEGETAKVLDFGIAKMKESALGDSGAIATRTGMVVGTPQYISPEQAMGRRGSELDGRADLYSLGVVLFEMVTGRLPFESDTAMGIILHHLQTPPPSAQDVRPDLGIPGPLSAVLMRALEKDPEKRFPSATAMASALDEVLALPLVEGPEHAERAAAAEAARPLTPRPVPADIEFHETRVMPKTPPVGGRTPPPVPFPLPGPATAAAPRTPPPLPHTPAPVPTMAGVPSPTVVGAGGAMSTPPPLPPPTSVFAPPPAGRSRSRPWWVWLVAVAALYAVCHRGRDGERRDRVVTPEPAASAADGGDEAGRDPAIAVAVEQVLRSDPRTRRQDIEVEVDEGIVTLSGHATPSGARQAERLVSRVDGVRKVVNTIEADRAESAERPEASEHPERAEPPEPPGPHVAPPGPAVIPSIPAFPLPRHAHGREPADPETFKRLMAEARDAMSRGEAGEAMGKYGAALGMDPGNQEAREGMKAATLLLGETIARRVMSASPSPSPH